MERGGWYVGSVQKLILEILNSVPAASTSSISRKLKRPYHNVLRALYALKDKGLIKDIRRREYYPGSLSYLEARYWYLPEKESEALRWLGLNSHTLPKKKL